MHHLWYMLWATISSPVMPMIVCYRIELAFERIWDSWQFLWTCFLLCLFVCDFIFICLKFFASLIRLIHYIILYFSSRRYQIFCSFCAHYLLACACHTAFLELLTLFTMAAFEAWSSKHDEEDWASWSFKTVP